MNVTHLEPVFSELPIEHFATPEDVADHLKITRRQVIELARKGSIPGHPIGSGSRRVWRFKISEVDSAIASAHRNPQAPVCDTIPPGSLRSRKGRS